MKELDLCPLAALASSMELSAVSLLCMRSVPHAARDPASPGALTTIRNLATHNVAS